MSELTNHAGAAVDAPASSSATSSPLAAMTATTPTRLFNDSCASNELAYAIERGATGATSNPVICLTVLRSEASVWQPRIRALATENPGAHERDLAWQLYCEMGVAGARQLSPVFAANDQTWGRISVQTDPTLHNQRDAMLEQATALSLLQPNMQVKTPCTAAGVAMIEEATYRGVSLNVTVSFSVPQVLAIADAVERGLERRDREGLDTTHMAPVATFMMGRLDDWLKVVSSRNERTVATEVLDWAGLAAFKRAYDLFGERRYRTVLLAAAYRHLGHWSEIVGGRVVQTMPHEWQVKVDRAGVGPADRIGVPVAPNILRDLLTIPEFVQAYEPDGLSVAEFDSFGPTVRTLRSFIGAWYDFVAVVRDVTLPDPDSLITNGVPA